MYVYKVSWTEFSYSEYKGLIEGSRDEFLTHTNCYSQQEFVKLVQHLDSTYVGRGEHTPGWVPGTIYVAVYNERDNAYDRFLYVITQMKENLGFQDFNGYQAEYEF